MENWTEEELEAYEESGWSGQVVCGLKMDNKTILSPLAEMFPDVLEDKDEIAPSQLSCSNIAESEPQRVLTNRMAAMSVAPYVNQLLAEGTISSHMTFFHSKEGYMKSQ
ncbi:hypothetical protein [Oceanobacillus massiliensis]|uniref:hypothetical protein n=1 Tax=Oceanobacillus massiliensis TaxID=1465765 RepID=UPI003018C524